MRPGFRLRGLRAAQFSIASVMLAAPASAVALSSTAPAEAPHPVLTAHVGADQLTLGRPLLVDGRATAHASGSLVELEAAYDRAGGRTAWRRVATRPIGPHGGWAFHTRLQQSADVRAVEVTATSNRTLAVGATTPTAAAPMAVSHETHVQVRARMRVAARELSAVAGRDAAVGGRLLPAHAGRMIAVQARSGTGWRTVGRARTGVAGGFSVRFTPPAGAGRRLRAVFAGDRLNGGASSAAGSVTLYSPVVVSWYDDAGSTACGFHAVDGVASRTLPCGTEIHLRAGGRSVTATVDDRGPYVYGREFDLNQNTAGALGFSGVGIVDASIG